MIHIETIELGSSQSSITFSSIPQDYDDLVIKVSARGSTTSSALNINVQVSFNGVTTNRSSVELFGTGSSTGSGTFSELRAGYVPTQNATSNTFSSNSVYVSNYTKSQAKSLSTDGVAEGNDTGMFMSILAGLWNDTSAVTSVTLTASGANDLLTGSTFSLYGVTAGGDGTVTTS